MTIDSEMDDTFERDGSGASLTPSLALLNRMIGTSPPPRMLEPHEIDLLRKSKEEVLRVTGGNMGKGDPADKELLCTGE